MKIILSLIILFSFLPQSTNISKEKAGSYCNDRFGYTSVKLILNADSTYSFKRWNHTSGIEDHGKWGRNKSGAYYLTSSEKTRWKNGKNKTGKNFLFIRDSFDFHNDTIKIISKNEMTTRAFYDIEYKLFKCIK